MLVKQLRVNARNFRTTEEAWYDFYGVNSIKENPGK